MVARVAHVFGVERLGLGVIRGGLPEDLAVHAYFKCRMFPRYILSFAASFVSLLSQLLTLAHVKTFLLSSAYCGSNPAVIFYRPPWHGSV